MELDHIEQRADSMDDSIANAIPVCFECHAEIHCYNDRHPRGRKYHPKELRGHKEQWISLCKTNPPLFESARKEPGVGPIQALVDELEFNLLIAQNNAKRGARAACMFLEHQFRQALSQGAVALLNDELKRAILSAYFVINSANQQVAALVQEDPLTGPALQQRAGAVQSTLTEAIPLIERALQELIRFLGTEGHE